MLLTRLRLKNFRVFEQELDLPLPPGLVGVYGPNGAGKSTLLEAVLFALWGRARTSREEVRTAGSGGECLAEVEFEHEGHLYLVRRALRGTNPSVQVEARCDGVVMASTPRDAGRFVESVLGMDDSAFRASVFAEQKQLAAFTSQAPRDRRDLVLALLGVTPLDGARDAARRDARELTASHDRLRAMLPDLEALAVEAADTAAAAGAAEVAAAEEKAAAAAARARWQRAEAGFRALDERRREHDLVVAEGRAVRSELDGADRALRAAADALAELDRQAAGREALQAAAAGLEEDERDLQALVTAAGAEPAGQEIRGELAGATALLQAAEAELAGASRAAARSGELSGAEECPTCGQALGDSYRTVQTHRRAEVEAAAARRSERAAVVAALEARLAEVTAQAAAEAQARASAAAALREVLSTKRQAAQRLLLLQGRLEARCRLEAAREEAGLARDSAAARVEVLREKLRAIALRPEEVEEAAAERDRRAAEAQAAAERAHSLALHAARAAQKATGAAERLAEARAAHTQLAELEAASRHTRRASDLLSAFRNSVVAAVGPSLGTLATGLFGELTDHEYDGVDIDPDDFGLQIRDGGERYGLDRFSGSEVDLANLALRVAISEHIHFQSGGSVGLLVLDEVFGPLDDDRKARMVAALERLRGRFRQVIVVTHDADVKEQMPNAIEVVKLPGRRATARVVGD